MVNDAAARHEIILQQVEQNEHVDVAYLSKILKVSDMTVRRDLEKLEKENKLVRVYGGARNISQSTYEAALNERIRNNFAYKEEIGKLCANLIEDGDVIALDASSTAQMLARKITAEVQVVTNNISIAQELSMKENVEIVLLGGNIRKKSCSTIGMDAIKMMSNLSVDKLFLSSKAISYENGISDATQQEGEMKKAMIEASERVFFMADYTKLGTKAFYKVGPIGCADVIITNYRETYNKPQQEFIDKCRQNNVELYLAGKPE